MIRFLITFICIIILFCCCKKSTSENTTSSTIEGHLTLERYWHTFAADTGLRHDRTERALAYFIDQEYTPKSGGTISYGDSILHHDTVHQSYASINPDSSVAQFSTALDGGRLWFISGDDQNRIPSFSLNSPFYSSIFLINLDTIPVISKSHPYTINWQNNNLGDSVTIEIYDGGNSPVSSGLIAGSLLSYTFSPTDLSPLYISSPIPYNFDFISIKGWNKRRIFESNIPIYLEAFTSRSMTVSIVN